VLPSSEVGVVSNAFTADWSATVPISSGALIHPVTV
jgi:hypothetical protein